MYAVIYLAVVAWIMSLCVMYGFATIKATEFGGNMRDKIKKLAHDIIVRRSVDCAVAEEQFVKALQDEIQS